MEISIAAPPLQPDETALSMPICHPWLRAALRTLAVFGCVLNFAGAARADAAAEARALLTRGDAAAALAGLDAALARAQPGLAQDPQLRFLRGVALMDLQRDDAALADFERMTQDYPELPDPYNNIALLQARAGRLEPARQALETALRNDPSHRAARINLGHVHLMLAAQAWQTAAAAGAPDPALLSRLQGLRALLGAPAAPPVASPAGRPAMAPR